MKNADRLIRIMYKELNYDLYTLNKSNIKNKSITEHNRKKFSMFDLKNEHFIILLKNKYLEAYPDNYNMDEVNIIIEEQKQHVKDRYGQTNALFLFPYYAEKLFKFVNSSIKVNFDDILEWDGFVNKVDGNIFIAAFLASNNISSKAYQQDEIIYHTNNRLYTILDKGVSENHMHLKASGYTTDLNWAALLDFKVFDTKIMTKFVSDENNFEKLKTCGKKNDDIILYIQKVKLVRIYLMQLIDVYKSNFSYISEDMTDYYIGEIDMLQLLCVETKAELETFRAKIQKVERIYQHNFKIKTGDIKQSYLAEREFLTELFSILLNGETTQFFMYLFNFYLAGLNLIKFEFVQDNIGMGFGKFKEKESVKEGFLNNNLKIYESVFDKYYKEGNIKKIEVRIAPKSKKDLIGLIKTLDKINEKYYEIYKKKIEAISKIEYGIIIHYIKNSDSLNNSCTVSSQRNNKMRTSLDKESKKTSDFFDLSSKSDYYKRKVIGIDAANVELRCRPEVFGSVFRKHRLESKKSNNLNFTYHVGEEFNAICNGLRAIDEVIEFLNFQRNDRLGHALALGMEIKTYFTKKRNFITSTLQDYIDDIVWLYYLIKLDGSAVTDHSKLLLHLAEEYEKYSKKLFRNTKLDFEFSMYDYMCAYQLRGDDPSEYKIEKLLKISLSMTYDDILKKINKKYHLNSDNKNHRDAFMNERAQRLLYLYHNNSSLRQQGDQIEIFEVSTNYIESVQLAQNLLQKKIYEKGISIEVNPSSNRKISSITKFIELPAFGINRVGLQKESLKDLEYHIPVSINTDDSSIFQTNLNNEYSMVAAALFKYGFANEDVYQYIEYLRKSSLEQSFIRGET